MEIQDDADRAWEKDCGSATLPFLVRNLAERAWQLEGQIMIKVSGPGNPELLESPLIIRFVVISSSSEEFQGASLVPTNKTFEQVVFWH